MSKHVTTLTTATPELERVTAVLIKMYPGYNPHRVRNRALAIGISVLAADHALLLDNANNEEK